MNTDVIDPIKIPTLLAHAHALAKHSSAPLSSLLTSIDKAQYQPWPTENAMRQGLLFQMEGSMSGVGQTGEIGDGTSLSYISYRCIYEIGADWTESKDVIMAEAQTQAAPQIHREEHGRKYDPDAVFTLDLNSDSDDD
jgi:mediator of RNA polymerase II transcription subunit 4